MKKPIVLGSVVTMAGLGSLLVGTASAAPTVPTLKVEATADSFVSERYALEGAELPVETFAGMPVYLTAGKSPIEWNLKRPDYSKPPVGTVKVNGKVIKIPTKMTPSAASISNFLIFEVSTADGVVRQKTVDFCPDGNTAIKTRPDAPFTNPYAGNCGWNPFTLGAKTGIQSGWSVQGLSGFYYFNPLHTPETEEPLADGDYTLKVKIAPAWVKLMKLNPADVEATIKVTLKTTTYNSENIGELLGEELQVPIDGSPLTVRTALKVPTSSAAKPQGVPTRALLEVPESKLPKPDLRSLPALGIGIEKMTDEETGVEGSYLTFGATVWNGGDGPLVVDGYRGKTGGVFDSYQYFVAKNGKAVGSRPAGTMEWDPRTGHVHWHFKDFAEYSLLDSTKKQVVVSTKESFCLANTDPVDTTLKNADLNPSGRDLSTACGSSESDIAIRETLATGWGDTYGQYLPGQSFDVTNLPNGTYYIKVFANPMGGIMEKSTKNNVSYRKVVLGGTPGGDRTVRVPLHQGIDSESGWMF